MYLILMFYWKYEIPKYFLYEDNTIFEFIVHKNDRFIDMNRTVQLS